MDHLATISIAPVAAPAEPEKGTSRCGGNRSLIAGRNEWFLIAASVLGVAGLALGSSILGFAAILPLLFILPCVVMAVMCMKGHAKGRTPDSGNAS